MTSEPDSSRTKSAIVSAFQTNGRHYESRLVNCGKVNCQKCGGSGPRHPSHGPYWYLCITHNGRWYRIYLGKDLDTTRFVTDRGNVDWPAIRAKRNSKRLQPAEKSQEAPGQLDALEQIPPDVAKRIEDTARKAKYDLLNPEPDPLEATRREIHDRLHNRKEPGS